MEIPRRDFERVVAPSAVIARCPSDSSTVGVRARVSQRPTPLPRAFQQHTSVAGCARGLEPRIRPSEEGLRRLDWGHALPPRRGVPTTFQQHTSVAGCAVGLVDTAGNPKLDVGARVLRGSQGALPPPTLSWTRIPQCGASYPSLVPELANRVVRVRWPGRGWQEAMGRTRAGTQRHRKGGQEGRTACTPTG